MLNVIQLTGVFADDLVFNHSTNGEKFYVARLLVERKSNAVDEVPMMISQVFGLKNVKGRRCSAIGSIRTHNNKEKEKTSLSVHVFVQEINMIDSYVPDQNEVNLAGYICTDPSSRVTKNGIHIANTILAANRFYGKTDYIPIILWGRNSQMDLHPGDKAQIVGRFQSRKYLKNGIEKTTYEISVMSLCLDI